MIARAFSYDRPCRFQKFEATETIVTTGTTIWKPGFKKNAKKNEEDMNLKPNVVRGAVPFQLPPTKFQKLSAVVPLRRTVRGKC